VSITVPGGSGITINEAKVWWYSPQSTSGSSIYSLAYADGGLVGQAHAPVDRRVTPDDFVLPSTTKNFQLVAYCANDDAGAACNMNAGGGADLQLFGSQLTLADANLPAGSVTGGALSGNGSFSGTQGIAYNASDGDSGVRTVQLILDGHEVTQNDYAGSCPYDNFLACPATISDTLTWDTAGVVDGTHELAMRVVNAGGNSTVLDEHTITTHNGPTVSSAPTITGTPAVGQTLAIIPATFSSPQGAGSAKISGQWQRCDSAGNNCVAIAGATGTSYNLTAADEGHMLRYQETISNNDGSAVTQSAAFGPITPSVAEKERTEKERIEREKVEKEKAGSNGSNGSNGASGSNGSNGPTGAGGVGGAATVDVFGSGSSQGLALAGSNAKWRVSLRVAPRMVHRHTTVRLSGVVGTSPRPGDGKLVYLQARSLGVAWKGSGSRRHRVTLFGKWVTFQAFRAKSNGTFGSTYKFKLGGRHTYQFQAVAPAEGQFRNPTGISSTITVKEI
jgi:hypothetical protein